MLLHKTRFQRWCWSNVAKDDVVKDVVEVVLQKTLLQKMTSASVPSKCTSTFFFFASFSLFFPCKEDNYECFTRFHLLLSLRDYDRKSNATFIVVFCLSYETRVEDNNEHASSLSSFFFSCIAKNNDEPPHSFSSSAIQNFKKHKIPKEDNKPYGSSSSSIIQKKKPWCWFFLGCRKWQRASRSSLFFKQILCTQNE